MKKILVKATLGHNGISTVVMNYYKELNGKDLHFDFITNDNINDLKAENIRLLELGNSRAYHFEKNGLLNIIKYYFNLFKFMRKNHYDIFHVHGSSSTIVLELAIAFICRIKIRIAHSHNSDCKYRTVHKILKPCVSLFSTSNLACSDFAGKWMFGSKYNIIYNGVNANLYKFNLIDREINRDNYNLNNKKVVLHVGVFTPTKNHSFILEIIEEICKHRDDYMFILVGDGPTKPNVVNNVLKLGLNDKVIFTGNINDVAKLYSVADLFILPSIFEGLPMVLIEAQFSQLRCIYSDRITKSVEISSICKPLSINNSAEWANMIIQLAENQERNTLINSLAIRYNLEYAIHQIKMEYGLSGGV